MSNYLFNKNSEAPFVIAGPCMAESEEVIQEVGRFMDGLSKELGFEYIFKASFDKANRTSVKSTRGPGWQRASKWFGDLKAELGRPILTDVHETAQVDSVAEVCDILQIPAFLCRQTDLLEASVRTGRAVNVKKGQFLAPQDTLQIAKKVEFLSEKYGHPLNAALTERGTTFGYGNLIVDMRGLKIMSDSGLPIIFDVTHSLQLPAAGQGGEVSGGQREYAPVLAKSAAATGALSGFFIEVHPEPSKALSDAATQLSFDQVKALLSDVLPIWKLARKIGSDTECF